MDKYFVLEGMNYLKLHNGISTACALSAAILILPVLAYADHDSGKGNKGGNDGQRWGERDEHRWGDHDRDRDRDVPVVPEANAGWVLVPFFGAVLLFSARHLFGAKEAKDS